MGSRMGGTSGQDPAVFFDENGLPTGPLGAQLWSRVCESLADSLEQGGWDQPARLFAVANPVTTEAQLGSDLAEQLHARSAADSADDPYADTDAGESIQTGFSVLELDVVPGVPVEELWGVRAPDWAAAVILTFEGWFVPPLLDADGTTLTADHAELSPAQHPRRRELRTVQMVTRAGEQHSAYRVRDDDGQFDNAEFGRAGGLLLGVLRRVAGAPARPASASVGDLLARLALRGALHTTSGVLHAARSGQAGPLDGALNADVMQALTRLPAAGVDQLAAPLFTKAFANAAARLAWRAAGRVEPVPDLGQATSMLFGIDPPAADAADRAAAADVVATARAAARLPFTMLAAEPQFADLLPEEVVEHAAWCDNALLGDWLCGHLLEGQRQLLGEVAALAGQETAQVATVLLGTLDWLAPRA